jgi:hypothetical protein
MLITLLGHSGSHDAEMRSHRSQAGVSESRMMKEHFVVNDVEQCFFAAIAAIAALAL